MLWLVGGTNHEFRRKASFLEKPLVSLVPLKAIFVLAFRINFFRLQFERQMKFVNDLTLVALVIHRIRNPHNVIRIIETTDTKMKKLFKWKLN